jgi:hypothetical protein
MKLVERNLAHECMRTYCHVAGIIQWLFAAWFGRTFLLHFGVGQFYHPASRGKGVDFPAYFDYTGLFLAIFFALLFVTAFFGGCALVRLRPWVRRWEAAYLGVLLIVTAVAVVAEMPRARLEPGRLTPLMLFALAFALPFLPFLSGDVVAYMARVARLRVRRAEPVARSVGVWDASLDG